MDQEREHEQRYGVVDGPDGTWWVRVPADRFAAKALDARHGRRFWCSTAAGGCGARLSLHAGEKNSTHFSHYAGQATSCPFAHDFDALERSYLHLALQQTLQGWLAPQGYTATLEHSLPDGGRADLYVTLEPGSQTIEVQLSPLPRGTWEARTTRYADQVDHVTWLFGPRAGAHLLDAEVRRTGYALGIRLADTTHLVDADAACVIEVGTVTRPPTPVQWSALTDCAMGPAGVTTPYVAAALEEHRLSLARAEQLAQVKAQVAARAAGSVGGSGHRDPLRWPAVPEPGREAAVLPGRAEVPRPVPAVAPRPRGAGRQPLSSYGWLSITDPVPGSAIAALDGRLREAGAVMAHVVSHVEDGGTDWGLSFPDVDDNAAIQEALVSDGVIELYDGPSGVRRWRRTRRAGN